MLNFIGSAARRMVDETRRAYNRFDPVRKSAGSRKLLSMLNAGGTSIANQMWTNRKTDLPEHFTGWHYVAIDAIASKMAGITPQYAYKRDNPEPAQMQKCLTKFHREKALTALPSSVQLEPLSPEHPLVRLHHRPNPIDCAWTYWYKVAMFLRITGEAYLWDVPNRLGVPAESWVIPSHWMWPLPSKEDMIAQYECRPVSMSMQGSDGIGAWNWFAGGAGKFIIPADQIVPFFMPSPHTMVGGYSPLVAGATWTDCTDNIDRSRVFKFQNDAFPSVAIEFDKDMDIEDISPAEIDRLKLKIKECYAGVKRTGEPVILGPGMKMVFMLTSPRDMDYVKGFDQLRDTVMALHRTSPIIVGMSKETTFASARASEGSWFNSTINPMGTLFGQVVTEHRCRKIDKNLICYWPDTMPRDIEFEDKQLMNWLDRNLIEIDEARAKVGMLPLSDGRGKKTLAEFLADTSVPKMLDDGQGSVLSPDANPDRLGSMFTPGRNGQGHEPALLTGKSLTDLSRRLLLCGPSGNGHHLEEA